LKQTTNLANQDTVQSRKSTKFNVGSKEVLSTKHFSALSVTLKILTMWLGERKNENNPGVQI